MIPEIDCFKHYFKVSDMVLIETQKMATALSRLFTFSGRKFIVFTVRWDAKQGWRNRLMFISTFRGVSSLNLRTYSCEIQKNVQDARFYAVQFSGISRIHVHKFIKYSPYFYKPQSRIGLFQTLNIQPLYSPAATCFTIPLRCNFKT